MGIFSNKCANTECSASVSKAAKYCNVCGEPASTADTNCGRCGAVVGAQSKFCWKCGGNLKEQQKVTLFDNRWVRASDDFAIRVDECDIKGFLSKGLIVEHGTRGMVFQRGRFCGYVDPGNYDLNGFLKKVNNFNQTTPTSVVLVDAGDVELHLEAIKLHSKEQVEVDAAFKALVQLTDPEKFYTNAFKSRNQLSVGYVAGSLTDELRSALQTYVGSKSVEDLYSNTAIRQEVERQMQLELEPILERIGLEMVQLRFVDFFCPAYDPIREEQAGLYIDTRKTAIDLDRLKLAQRMRKEMTADKMDQLKTENDFEDFVRQTEHELGLKDIIRTDEMDKLKRQFTHERDRDVLAHQIEIEGIKNDADREEARSDLEAKIENFKLQKQAKREDVVADSETEDHIKRKDIDRDIYEAREAVKLREETQRVELARQREEHKLEAEKLQERSKASAQALISILDGDAADRIMKLEELRAKEKLSPDQIIAMTASTSPHVAEVLAEKYKAEAAISGERFKQLQDFMAKQEETSKDSADRLERVMNVAMQQMGATATTRAQAPQSSQTVVTPGGGMGGAPVVINPQGATAEKACPKCKQMIPSNSRFCPNCRERL
ncbi:SPFH domain-containing protein [Planctomycetota bacterium]